jgi:two-component system cell cycle sensor histidine kinase/response regulator CckA
MLRRSLGEHIAVEIQTGETPLPIHADPVMIEMVILNLAVNSRDAMPQGGRLSIRASELEITAESGHPNSKARPGKFACMQVDDNGGGIAPEVLPHLFEPFYTTKGVGKGTGLGLASVYGVVEQHAGWIEVESPPGRGATFKIFLPISAPKKPGTGSPTPFATEDSKGHETILLVEDEPALRRLAATVLRRQGYRVYDAGSGPEALSIWEEHGPEIHLLLTDMVMPGGLSGPDLARQLREKNSDLKIVYTTGYSRDAVGQNLGLREGLNFLAKPYHPDNLRQTVRRGLDECPQA